MYNENKSNKCKFVEYDAWENEKFPFKLGFLEKLIEKYKEFSANAIEVDEKDYVIVAEEDILATL